MRWEGAEAPSAPPGYAPGCRVADCSSHVDDCGSRCDIPGVGHDGRDKLWQNKAKFTGKQSNMICIFEKNNVVWEVFLEVFCVHGQTM